ncbi:MAG TPA: GNAT family N-acetyltransferase [Candidatus Bathyarchaeia archaeon]|nr:GNAT family N-acetyltransferase [Candidatus Bathyarchaeia archaeon]
MRTLETERLLIRPFVYADATEFKRLLDEAFGGDGYGSQDAVRLLLDYNVIADKAHDALHQPPYEDRAIVLKTAGTLVGSVGLAPCLAPFGALPSFGGTAHRTPEVGLFWALFPAQMGRGYATEAARAMVSYAFEDLDLRRIVATTEHSNRRSIAVMRRLGMTIERNPRSEPHWFQTVGVLVNPGR